MSDPDRTECVACGGKGKSTKPHDVCVPCKGEGSVIVQHQSSSVELYTPSYIVEPSRIVLGRFDLDPASCALAQEVVRAGWWCGSGDRYDKCGDDGLAVPWSGRVFLNPPGGRVPDEYAGLGTRSFAALWWAKLALEWQAGAVEAAIFVGFTLEILRSAQALDCPQPLDFPMCVPKRRIAFETCDEHGGRVSLRSPTHANVIVYLPPVSHRDRPLEMAHASDTKMMADLFVDAFKEIGKCTV